MVSLSGGLLCAAGAASQQASTTWSGVYSSAQAAEGEAVYLSRCASCHQPDLSGGDDPPPLTGPQFGDKWNNRTLGDLFESIRRTMPQEDPGSLSTTEYAQVIAHLLQWNGFPEGASALSDRLDVLKDIRFLERRPRE